MTRFIHRHHQSLALYIDIFKTKHNLSRTLEKTLNKSSSITMISYLHFPKKHSQTIVVEFMCISLQLKEFFKLLDPRMVRIEKDVATQGNLWI